jgi:hypothetical protein
MNERSVPANGQEDLVRFAEIPPPPPEDPSRVEWMKIAEASPALEFWNRPDEDIYCPEDGEPI